MLQNHCLEIARLHDRAAALAEANRADVVGNFLQQAQRLQIFHDLFARHEAFQARIRAGVFVHVRVVGHHVDLR